MADRQGGEAAEVDFAGIVNEMAEAMPALGTFASRRNGAAQGLRALLDAGYVPVRSSGSAAQNHEDKPWPARAIKRMLEGEAARSPQGGDHEAVTPEMVDAARAAYRDYQPVTLAKYSEAWQFAKMRAALVAAHDLDSPRSPQGKDHEAGIPDAALDAAEAAVHACRRYALGHPSRKAIYVEARDEAYDVLKAALPYLSRCPSPQDEDHEAGPAMILASMADYEENVRCVVMPCCGFTFDAVHTDDHVTPERYTCPLCCPSCPSPERCCCGSGEAEDDRGAVLRCPVHGPSPEREQAPGETPQPGSHASHGWPSPAAVIYYRPEQGRPTYPQ